MCGIAGFVVPGGYPLEELMQVSEVLRHRGPDDEGYFTIDSDLGPQHRSGPHSVVKEQHVSPGKASLAMLHRRLSIIDLSAAGHQPMATADGSHVICYNGEVYNYLELRTELEALGYRFRTQTDTEVVLQALVHWGIDAQQHFRGMWAFAWYNAQAHTLTLSRDRFGIKPLYYAKNSKGLFFASEQKALRCFRGIAWGVDDRELSSYVAYGAVSAPWKSLFSGIEELEPGTWLRFGALSQEAQFGRYHSLNEVEAVSALSSETWHQSFARVFEESLRLHLRSDVPTGTCLSGGLDSSAIVAVGAQKLGSVSRTYTAAYEDASIDESRFAREVAHALQPKVIPNYVYPTAGDLWNAWSAMIYHQDLPVGSASIYAHWCVMREAGRQGTKVLLNGQGADELLGGYYPFAGLLVWEHIRAGRWLRAWKEYHMLKAHFTPGMALALGRAIYYQLPVGLQRQLRKSQRQGVELMSAAGQEIFRQIKVPERGAASFNELVRVSLAFNLGELLRYEDRNAMAFSIESRVPFLDPKLVALSLRKPAEVKSHGG